MVKKHNVNDEAHSASQVGMLLAEQFLQDKYLFRRNELNGKVEFVTLPAEGTTEGPLGWRPLTQQALNSIVICESSVVDDNSLISGVINMNFLYNKVYRVIKQNAYLPELADANDVDFEKMSKRSLHWSLTTGEVRVVNSAKKMAIDQVHNVIEFLEKVENGDIEDIDFLELRACYQSCAGGVLCAGNKFLTTDRARRRASNILGDTLQREDMEKYSQYLEDNCLIDGKIEPRSIVKLDDDMAEAMKKMKRINEINNILPQVDCGICGTPSCQAFAEDIVQKKADIKRCIFVQKILQQNDKLELSEATEIMKQTWGVGKLDKNLVRELKDELETED